MLFPLLIQLLVGLLIFALVWWGIGYLGLPDPVGRIVLVLFVIILVVFLLNTMLPLMGVHVSSP